MQNYYQGLAPETAKYLEEKVADLAELSTVLVDLLDAGSTEAGAKIAKLLHGKQMALMGMLGEDFRKKYQEFMESKKAAEVAKQEQLKKEIQEFENSAAGKAMLAAMGAANANQPQPEGNVPVPAAVPEAGEPGKAPECPSVPVC